LSFYLGREDRLLYHNHDLSFGFHPAGDIYMTNPLKSKAGFLISQISISFPGLNKALIT